MAQGVSSHLPATFKWHPRPCLSVGQMGGLLSLLPSAACISAARLSMGVATFAHSSGRRGMMGRFPICWALPTMLPHNSLSLPILQDGCRRQALMRTNQMFDQSPSLVGASSHPPMYKAPVSADVTTIGYREEDTPMWTRRTILRQPAARYWPRRPRVVSSLRGHADGHKRVVWNTAALHRSRYDQQSSVSLRRCCIKEVRSTTPFCCRQSPKLVAHWSWGLPGIARSIRDNSLFAPRSPAG